LAQSADQAVLLAGIAGFRMAYLQLANRCQRCEARGPRHSHPPEAFPAAAQMPITLPASVGRPAPLAPPPPPRWPLDTPWVMWSHPDHALVLEVRAGLMVALVAPGLRLQRG